jgi:hypothetical protein
VTDRKSPIEQAMDLFVYAPLGLLFNAEEVIPQLVEKGRQQVSAARIFGRFAVQQGGAEASKALGKVQKQAAAAAEQLGRGRPSSAGGAAAADRRAPAEPATTVRTEARSAQPDTSPVTLAIPDYQSLSASQVVPRLAGLADAELEAVRTYEVAHRGRKTILSKIAQLQHP